MKYEIISGPVKYQIFKDKQLRAEVCIQLTDQDIQHAKVFDVKNGIYYQSDFDLSLTRVPGIARSVYFFDREVVRFVFQDVFTYRVQTCHEELFTIHIHDDGIDITEDISNKKVANIINNPYNNHSIIEFFDLFNEDLQLAMALFPCIRFV